MTESCRLITTEQYQEYLKLKEEHKPLGWEELKEEAKKMGYELKEGITIKCEWITSPDGKWDFLDDGTIMHDNYVVSLDRTPDQMLAIMKALQ